MKGKFVPEFVVHYKPKRIIIRKVDKKSAIRMKKKLKKFNQWINEEIFTKQQATNAYYSWRGHMKRGNSYKIVKKMDAYKLNIIDK